MVNDSISGKPTRNSPMKNTKKLADNYTYMDHKNQAVKNLIPYYDLFF